MTPAAARRLAKLHRQLAEEYERLAGEVAPVRPKRRRNAVDKKRVEELARKAGVRLAE